MNQREPALVVIGATGYTGALIARELGRQPDGPPVLLAARDPARLAAVAEETGLGATAVVDVADPASLDALIQPGDAVINTAGPFTDLGEPVVRACVGRGAHYLDTTGEQPFMQTMRDRYHDAAVEAGVAVVNGMAWEYAYGDCAVAVLADGRGPIRSLDVIYAWGGTVSSTGTRRTIVRMLGQRGWVRTGGRFRPEPMGARHRTVTLANGKTLHAAGFGAGEVVTAPRYLDVDNARGWMVMSPRSARLLPFVAPALPFLGPLLRPVLEPIVTRRPDPTPAERESSTFTIRVELEPVDGPPLAAEIQGVDPYGLTAVAAIHGGTRCLAPDPPAGVLAPAQLVDPRSLLDVLAPRASVIGDITL